MNSPFILAKLAAIESVERHESMKPLWQSAITAKGQPATEMMAGLIDITCQVCDAQQAANLPMVAKTPAGKQIMEAAPHARKMMLVAAVQRQDQAAASLVADLSDMVEAASHRTRISHPRQPPPEAAEPAPLRVEIVALPDRITETTVTRDREGNIKETVQTEFDG